MALFDKHFQRRIEIIFDAIHCLARYLSRRLPRTQTIHHRHEHLSARRVWGLSIVDKDGIARDFLAMFGPLSNAKLYRSHFRTSTLVPTFNSLSI